MKHAMLAMMLALCAVTSTASAQRVVFSEAERADSQTAFYMDGQGDLYPPASIRIDYRDMTAARPVDEYATLKALFKEMAEKPDDRQWRAVLASAKVRPSGNFEADWAAVQTAYRQQTAERIRTAAQGADQVVLLIHGFNNDYRDATDWYAAVEEDFNRFAKSQGTKVSFVRMYWDGLVGSPPAIWTAAQANGPWVGLELRRLLNLLPSDFPLRVFTHSSGAFVMTNAMGDGSSAYPKLGHGYREMAAGGGGYDIPRLTNLRVAMLVPAQPLSAFAEYEHADGTSHGLVPQRLILGTSKHDFATGKARALTKCTWYGATCMTTMPSDACRRVWGDLGQKPLLVNFRQKWWGSHDHAVIAYMRDPEWPELARGLLADEPGVPQGDSLCDKPAYSKKLERS